jgi:hypothetical protein
VTREEQRLKTMLRQVVESGAATLFLTSHLNEIEMTRLEQNGVEVLRDYPAEQRRRMAGEGRALPDGSFPIKDCTDAGDAIHSIGRAAPEKRSRAEAHIRKRVRALGCTGSLFENWK